MKYPFGEVKYQTKMLDCYGFHSHDFLVISAIEKGQKLRFDFMDESVEVDSTSIICFPPRVRHKAVISSTINGYIILHLDIDWICSVYGIDALGVTWSKVTDNLNLHERFLELTKELSRTYGATEELEEWLWDYFSISIISKHNIKISNSVLEDIHEYIDKEWENPTDMKELADLFDLNLFTMIRQFRNYFGVTPKKHQLDVRVHRAKEMIAGGMDITQAALSCGFYDQSHLYNYFKKIFGVSPKTYQEAFEQ